MTDVAKLPGGPPDQQRLRRIHSSQNRASLQEETRISRLLLGLKHPPKSQEYADNSNLRLEIPNYICQIVHIWKQPISMAASKFVT